VNAYEGKHSPDVATSEIVKCAVLVLPCKLRYIRIRPLPFTFYLTPVPRSTQPSTLHGAVKRVSAFGLNNTNNTRRWWMWMVAAYRRTHGQVGSVVTRRSVCIHQVNQVNSSEEYA